jgi:hypothetical protein
MEKASEHSTKTVKNFIFFDNIFECLYLYHITGLVLALLLVTGSSTKPADYRNIGYRYNLPVIKRRLQRDFNRAVLETKIGFYTTVTRDIMARDNLDKNTTRKLCASGVVHPESKQILSYIRRNHYTPFETLKQEMSISYTKTPLSSDKLQQGPFLLKLPDTHPSSTNPQGCQTKASYLHSHTESQDL